MILVITDDLQVGTIVLLLKLRGMCVYAKYLLV